MCIRDSCYKERDDVGAVLHAHPPTATGYAVAHIPVSYTHLDVYKRQLCGCRRRYRGTDFACRNGAARHSRKGAVSVSYTHLDVYKRQGIGTVVTAFMMGPVVAFFNKHVSEKLLAAKMPRLVVRVYRCV